MASGWTIFPDAMTMHDLATMRQATRLAEDMSGASGEGDRDQLAWMVFRYYKRGLIDPKKLAEVAVLLSSSRTFKIR